MRTLLALLALTVAAHAADAPAPVTTPLLDTKTTITGQTIVVPANPELRVVTVVFRAGLAAAGAQASLSALRLPCSKAR